MSPPGGCKTSCKADPMPGIRIIDETWVTAPLPAVAAVIGDEARWPAWWPDLQLQVTERRGLLGVRWGVAGTVRGPAATGSMEVWLLGCPGRRATPLLPPTGSGGPARRPLGALQRAGQRHRRHARRDLLGDQGRIGDMAGPCGGRRQTGAAVASPHARRVHASRSRSTPAPPTSWPSSRISTAIPRGPGRSRPPRCSRRVPTGGLSGSRSPSTRACSRTRTSSPTSGVVTGRWSGTSYRDRCMKAQHGSYTLDPSSRGHAR